MHIKWGYQGWHHHLWILNWNLTYWFWFNFLRWVLNRSCCNTSRISVIGRRIISFLNTLFYFCSCFFWFLNLFWLVLIICFFLNHILCFLLTSSNFLLFSLSQTRLTFLYKNLFSWLRMLFTEYWCHNIALRFSKLLVHFVPWLYNA